MNQKPMSLNENHQITKFLSGEMTEEEIALFKKWLSESDENRNEFSKLKKLWNVYEDYQKALLIDEKKAYKNVSRKLSKSRKLNFGKQLQRVAAVLFLPVLLISGWTYYNAIKIQKQYTAVYNTAETPLGMRSSLTLPDGTKVWLNSGSKLTYPIVFGSKSRTVTLSGEAYFEVEKSKSWPFIVEAQNFSVMVLGTSFNCTAYPEDLNAEVALVEGKVDLFNKSATRIETMNPGELIEFNNKTQDFYKSKADLNKYIAWKTGRLMFRDDKMNVVVEKMERWYNVDIEIMDKEISSYVYTATFIDESLDQVLKMLSLSAPIFYMEDERAKLSDGTFTRPKIKMYKKRMN